MKILHTADWHLGASFGPEKRTREFSAVLQWLLRTIAAEHVEAVILAGDIFDSGVPSNSASELYYRFLSGAHAAGVRSIIAVAGNHDSASFLEAPKWILAQLNVSVIGHADKLYSDEQIIPLRERNGEIGAVVCAVPYLRDRDVRTTVSGETIAQQQNSRKNGMLRHYRDLCARARELYPDVPLIATGHFYAAGGTVSGWNTVGNLSSLAVSELPESIDYLALGHLHTAQPVGGRVNCRYSGSLLQMSFGDQDCRKVVLLLDTARLSDPPLEIPIPVFQKIEKITGDTDAIRKRLNELKSQAESVWVCAENTGEFDPDLQQRLNSCCEKSPVRIITCRNLRENPILKNRQFYSGKKLSELNPQQVFLHLLEERQLPAEKQAPLLQAFHEAVRELAEDDARAES